MAGQFVVTRGGRDTFCSEDELKSQAKKGLLPAGRPRLPPDARAMAVCARGRRGARAGRRGADARAADGAGAGAAVERRGHRRLHLRHPRLRAAARLPLLPARHLLLVARAQARGRSSRTAGTAWRSRAWCCRSCSWCRRRRAARSSCQACSATKRGQLAQLLLDANSRRTAACGEQRRAVILEHERRGDRAVRDAGGVQRRERADKERMLGACQRRWPRRAAGQRFVDDARGAVADALEAQDALQARAAEAGERAQPWQVRGVRRQHLDDHFAAELACRSLARGRRRARP